MSVNIHTIKDIRSFLSTELDKTYHEPEKSSLINIVIKNVTGISKLYELYDPAHRVSDLEAGRIIEICRELKSGKPVQYIFGETEFYGFRIRLNEETLIPRPETEELVDLIISENRNFKGNITDFGTGSGCIAIALAANIPGAVVTGFDISRKAVEQARENAELNRVKVNFAQGDIFNMDKDPAVRIDIAVSNPPYVRESEKILMNRNVLEYEPHKALFVPDTDPLIFYRSIVKTAGDILAPGGKIYFEINEAMGARMIRLLETYGFTGISVVRDINNKDRIIKGKKND